MNGQVPSRLYIVIHLLKYTILLLILNNAFVIGSIVRTGANQKMTTILLSGATFAPHTDIDTGAANAPAILAVFSAMLHLHYYYCLM